MYIYVYIDIYTQWNIIQPWERRKSCHLWQHRTWGHYARWNKSDRKTDTVWYHLYAESKKLIETETRMVVTRGLRGGENGEVLVKGYKLPVIRQISSEDLMHNMVIIVKNTVLHTWKLLKQILNVLTTKKKW